jgi:translocation and assembly module TamB
MQLRSQGKLTGLPLAWIEAFGANLDLQERAGITGDLVFDGAWDINAADTLRANVKVARASGDIRVRAGESAQIRRIETTGTGTKSETRFDNGLQADAPATPAGLRKAEIEISAQGDAVRAQLTWDSERAGQLTADLRTSVAQQDGSWSWPEAAPLSGKIQARMPDVGVWSVLAPPAWRINGTLVADATLAGTRTDPQWNGSLSADKLSVKAAVEGIELQDGKLRAALRGNRLQIDEFTLAGGSASRARIAGQGGNLSTVSSESAKDGGDVKVTGDVSWGAAAAQATGSNLQMNLQARLRSLRVLVRSDRQVTVSGNVSASLDQGGQLLVRGVVKTDRGVIILADESAPTLGTDVSVRSAAIDKEAAAARARTKAAADTAAARATAPTPRKPPDIAVTIDIGDDFAVQGHGLTTRLGGQIEVRSNANSGGQPRITGEIRTVQGRYRAYGQQLDVDSGVARFNGPYDNPSLDILAIRPNLQSQKAGVRITGTAQSPRVALYSDPTLTDAETLSWMMLGRSTAGGGAEAALMQQAALALLGGFGPKGGGGNFASRFGLDEIGFKGPASGEDARSSAVTLGKRLSNEVYVTYEASLAGALGTLYIFYDLTRRLALRGQAGARGAVDLIYTVTYD